MKPLKNSKGVRREVGSPITSSYELEENHGCKMTIRDSSILQVNPED